MAKFHIVLEQNHKEKEWIVNYERREFSIYRGVRGKLS